MQLRRVQDLVEEAAAIHREALRLRSERKPEEAEVKYKIAEDMYNQILNKVVGDAVVSYFLGTLYMERGWNGLAIQLLSTAVQNAPDWGEAWNNLGICFIREHRPVEADEFFANAEKYLPETSDIPANRSSIYINNGTPQTALGHAERCLKIDPENKLGKWHKALALLEMGKFKEAWPLHENRLNNSVGVQIAPRDYGKPRWDGKKKKVVIHGEQGLGDEIMFASCIPEARSRAEKMVLECAPRLEGLFRRSFPTVDVVGTHKLDGSDLPFDIDAWCPLGSLPLLLKRNHPRDFPQAPYLQAHAEAAAELRGRGDGRPRVGFAWQGGVDRTRIDLRSVSLDALKPILSMDADFVPLQYTPHAKDELAAFNERSGLNIQYYPEAAAQDMDAPAALVASCDLVISVCQTAVHLAGGLGVPCWTITPSRASWRYMTKGKKMPWYGGNEMFRQVGDDWDKPLKEIEDRLGTHLQRI